MKTKNKRIKANRTMKYRGGGGNFSRAKPPKDKEPSPPQEKIKKARFNKNPVTEEWVQSPRSPSEFYYPIDKPKTNLEIDEEDIMRINKNRKNKNKQEISRNKYIDQKSSERIKNNKTKKKHVKDLIKSKNPRLKALAEERRKELQMEKDMEDLRNTKYKMQAQMKL